MEMNQNKARQKLRDLLELEIGIVEQGFVKDPLLKNHLVELLEAQQFLVEVKEVAQIYG
jgi:hypothetical protein